MSEEAARTHVARVQIPPEEIGKSFMIARNRVTVSLDPARAAV